MDINKTAEQLLYAVKTNSDQRALRLTLSGISLSQLKSNLDNDDKRKAFWINLYNAFFQILRKEEKLIKPAIYRKKRILIAGKNFSLDDIEHGILRRFRYKYSLGFFANVFSSRLIKQLAVDKLDYRIHFALNCGAESCPPIAFYNYANIDGQLDMATQSFLEGETSFDEENKIAHTTTLFKWFLADFGGTKGIKNIFAQQLNKDLTNYQIKYKAYSWEENLDNYR